MSSIFAKYRGILSSYRDKAHPFLAFCFTVFPSRKDEKTPFVFHFSSLIRRNTIVARSEKNILLSVFVFVFKIATAGENNNGTVKEIAQKRFYIENGEGKMNITRGDIYYADLSPVVGSEQGGVRPVLIVQNDVGNRYSPTVIAAAITSRIDKVKLPTHISVSRASCSIDGDGGGLQRDSVILLEQIRTIDKSRLKEKMGHLDDALMRQVDEAISVSFGLVPTDNVQDGGAMG